MNDVQLTRRLNELGLERWDIERLIKTRQLERVRRGAYAEPLPDVVPIEERHLRLVRATMPQLYPGAVLSHGSAAAMHGLPVWESELGRVHVTRSRSGGGQRRSGLHVHVAPLLVGDIETIDGYPVTSIARTVLDQARTSPFQQAVALADRALALGLQSAELEEGLAQMARWPGVRKARRTCGFADGRSESVGESMSRVRFVEQELPTPALQYEVYDGGDSLIARSDFGWEERGTLGEFDGKIKYGRLLKPGQRVEDVVYAEKRREDALRDRGWQVVRWTWEDLARPEVIRDRLLRAFDRAERSGVAPDIVRRCSA
jgi:hypothetical protein